MAEVGPRAVPAGYEVRSSASPSTLATPERASTLSCASSAVAVLRIVQQLDVAGTKYAGSSSRGLIEVATGSQSSRIEMNACAKYLRSDLIIPGRVASNPHFSSKNFWPFVTTAVSEFAAFES